MAYNLLRQVINQYLVAKYKGQGPDLLPAEPEAAAKAWLIARIHDMYITPVQVHLQRPAQAAAIYRFCAMRSPLVLQNRMFQTCMCLTLALCVEQW